MLISFIFKNHKGVEFRFGEGCVFANRHDLYDYTWEPTMVGNRVGRLERGNGTHTIPLILISYSADEVDAAIDRLVDLAESDVAAGESGSVIINGYTYRCYITAVKHDGWLPKKGYCRVTLTVQPDGGYWTKELPAQPFNSETSALVLEGDDDLTQPLKQYANPTIGEPDYSCYIYGSEDAQSGQATKSYTFAEGNEHRQVEVQTACKMRLSIYGAVTLTNGISITIGNQTYSFGGAGCPVTIGNGEKLILDQARQTIEKEDANGVRTNAFGAWMTFDDNDLFAPLEAGVHEVVWSGFSFYLTLIEERSSPRWL